MLTYVWNCQERVITTYLVSSLSLSLIWGHGVFFLGKWERKEKYEGEKRWSGFFLSLVFLAITPCSHNIIPWAFSFLFPMSFFSPIFSPLKSWKKRLLFKRCVYLEHPQKPLTTFAISLSCYSRFVRELNIRSKNLQKYWWLSSYHM